MLGKRTNVQHVASTVITKGSLFLADFDVRKSGKSRVAECSAFISHNCDLVSLKCISVPTSIDHPG